MKDIWMTEANSKWLNLFGKIKTPVQRKGRTELKYVVISKTVWKHKWAWVICILRLLLGFFARIYFLPRHRRACRQPGWFSSYNPSYLHYEALALTTMAWCHSSGVDFCIYLFGVNIIINAGLRMKNGEYCFICFVKPLPTIMCNSINTTEYPSML